MLIKDCFGKYRVIGLAGDKSTGKTNNLIALIKDFREENKTTKIYVYGLNERVLKYIIPLKEIYEVSSLDQLADKKDSLIILDEFQMLNLGDRRYKAELDLFINFIYHNNNWLILSSPNLRDFNSIIGSKVERWLCKSMRLSSLINGSQLKERVLDYNGRFKSINCLVIPLNTILIINEEFEKYIELPYIKEIDKKTDNINIFENVK